MKKIAIVLTMTLLALDAAVLLTGCTNQTEGERTISKGSQIQDAGDMIKRGEILVADGKAAQARGEEMKRQGANPAGDRLIAEGRADEKKGQELISQGRKIRDKAQ